MAYYKTCLSCGAHLDPGERCDCTGKTINLLKPFSKYDFPKDKKSCPGGDSTRATGGVTGVSSSVDLHSKRLKGEIQDGNIFC